MFLQPCEYEFYVKSVSAAVDIATNWDPRRGNPQTNVVKDGQNEYSYIFTIQVLEPPPIFDFLLSSGGITVARGGSGWNTITVTLVSGSTQLVTFSDPTGLPSGASASYSPSRSANPNCDIQLIISTTSNTPTGPHPITVTGAGARARASSSVTMIEPFVLFACPFSL